jgi:hypothetical protein
MAGSLLISKIMDWRGMEVFLGLLKIGAGKLGLQHNLYFLSCEVFPNDN